MSTRSVRQLSNSAVIPQGGRPPKAKSGSPDWLPIFYINRDCDETRRVFIECGLNKAGMSAERICGVEGLNVPAKFRAMFFDAENRLHSRLKPGEVGCYASHLKALELLIERRLDRALILEDDAMLPIDLQQIITRILPGLPPAWDLVHLCRNPSRAVKPIAKLACGGTIVRYSRIPENTTGYLISRTGAEKFLVPVKRYWPIDTDFRQPWRFGLEVYGIVPSVISASETFPSAIHLMGGRSRLRRGLPKPSLHCWTGNPLHTPQGLFFNVMKLGISTWAICFLHNTFRRANSILIRPLLRLLATLPWAPRST